MLRLARKALSAPRDKRHLARSTLQKALNWFMEPSSHGSYGAKRVIL